MYQKIMTAMDGSETSKRALGEALRLARMAHARVHLVYVVDSMPAIGMGMTYVLPDVLDGFREDSRKLLDAAREEGRKAGVDCDAELFELQGAADDVPGCLLSCARRYGAELVVLGTHGRRGVARAMLGSVAEGFVRIAECPVLLVPRRVAP